MTRKNDFSAATILVAILYLVIGIPVFYTVFKLFPPLTDAEIERYTNIASDVYYNQLDKVVLDVPSDVDVEIDSTSITVKPGSNQWSRGAVICKVENGTLTANYEKHTLDVIFISIIITTFLCVFLIVFSIITSDIRTALLDKLVKKEIKTQPKEAY